MQYDLDKIQNKINSNLKRFNNSKENKELIEKLNN